MPNMTRLKSRNSMESIEIFYQNVRGLRSKTVTFYNNICAFNSSDVIALTETFLNSSVINTELFPPGYVVFRKDRANEAGWGGVLLAVKDTCKAKLVTDIDGITSKCEVLFVLVSRKNVKFLICVVYCPPNYKENEYLEVLSCLENAVTKYSTLDIAIVGDFNLNSFGSHVKSQYEQFTEFCALNQHSKIRNKYGGILDLVLSNMRCADIVVREAVAGALVPIDAFHPPLEVTLRLPPGTRPLPSHDPNGRRSTFSDWNFRKADLSALYGDIFDLEWEDVLAQQEVDIAVDAFYNKLYTVIDKYVPKKRVDIFPVRRYPPWYTPEIISKIKIKFFHLKKFKSLGLDFNHEVYKYYRSHVKCLIAEAYRTYITSIENGIRHDPAKFWTHVNYRRKDYQSCCDFIDDDGGMVTGQEAVTAFARYFSSVFHSNTPLLDPTEAESRAGGMGDAAAVRITRISVDDLSRAIRRLKPSSPAGPDGMPTFLVKDCGSVLKLPLLHIFNLSVQKGHFPSTWKVSRVTPVPKSGTSKKITMHRPIAILSVFGKVFEHILNFYVKYQICNRLDTAQHGFRCGRSTMTNLISFVDYVASEMDKGRQVDATYFDFKKAFDLVDNDILLEKLSLIGFTPGLLKLFASYLGDRKQYVKLGSYYQSDPYFTRSGVSQGSILGPTLFLVMINDLPKVLNTARCLLFADDLKLYHPVNSVIDCQALQRDINAIYVWCEDNRLQFNVTKCKVLSFTRSTVPTLYQYSIGNIVLERVQSIRDLGVIIDSKLDFHDHIATMCKAANKTLGFIMRTSAQFRDAGVAVMLYNAFVRSRLEYCATIWNPCEDIYTLLIEKTQRKFARYLYKRKYGYYPLLFPSLFVSGMVGLDTLELRRKIQAVVQYAFLLRGKVDNPGTLSSVGLFVPDKYLRTGRRRHHLFALPVHRTCRAGNAPTRRALSLINCLVSEVQDADIFYDSISQLTNKLNKICN